MSDKNHRKTFYPEHKYDKDGYLRPSKLYYWIIAYLLRGYVIITMASSYGSNTNAILGVFYPNPKGLYANLVVGIPALIALGLLTYRSQLRDKGKANRLKLVKPMLFVGLLADIALQFHGIYLIHWRFEQVPASTLLAGIMSLVVLVRLRVPD